MDEDSELYKGPVELVFRNPKTNHIARFDRRLRFDPVLHAMIFQEREQPCFGLTWQIIDYIAENDLEKYPNCVPFQTLLDEANGIIDGGRKWELLLEKGGILYRMFTEEHDCCGTKELATMKSLDLDVPIEGAAWVIRPYDETREMSIPNFGELFFLEEESDRTTQN